MNVSEKNIWKVLIFCAMTFFANAAFAFPPFGAMEQCKATASSFYCQVDVNGKRWCNWDECHGTDAYATVSSCGNWPDGFTGCLQPAFGFSGQCPNGYDLVFDSSGKPVDCVRTPASNNPNAPPDPDANDGPPDGYCPVN